MAGTLTITTPSADNASGYDTSSRTIAWTFAGSPGTTTQVQRQVVVRAAGSSAILFDSTMQASTGTSYTVSGISSGTYYDVTVTVIDSAGATTSATRRIISTYTRPLAPVITLSTSGPNVVVGITNPTSGSRPAVTTNSIYRRPATSTGAWMLLGTVGNGGTFVDRTPRSGEAYAYFVRGLA